MFENFEKLPLQQQERILSACLEEFADKGYTRASTNAIVEKADIAKGTLFYFFGSKKKLFFYLLDNAILRYTGIFKEMAGEQPADLFERLLYQAQVKFRFAVQEPLLYRFFFKIFLDIPAELQSEMQQRFSIYTTASFNMTRESLDLSRFKDNVNAEDVIEMIYLMMDGLANRYTQSLKQTDAQQALELAHQLEVDCRKYFEMIKLGVYR